MSALLKSSILLSAALVLGRLFGFFREILLAARLGVSAEADLGVVILTLPDLLVGILLTGGFTAALVPALKRRAEGRERIDLYRFVASWAAIAGCILGLIVAVFADQLTRILAPALPDDVAEEWIWAVRLTGAAIPLAALSGVTNALLNVKGVFFFVGLGSAVYNLVICLALVPFDAPDRVLMALTWGVLAAGVVRLSMLMRAARAPLTPRITPPPGADRRLLGLFASGVLAMGITFFANLVFRTLAATQGEGALAAFAYALRLFELPIGLVLAPITTVLLPRLSEGGDTRRLVLRALVVLAGLGTAILGVGLTLGEQIAALIYYRGEMTEEGLADIVRSATWMFFALPFSAVALLGAAVLNARQQTGVLFQNAAIALLLGGTVALIRPDLVLAGFILFHVTAATLNLWRAREGLL